MVLISADAFDFISTPLLCVIKKVIKKNDKSKIADYLLLIIVLVAASILLLAFKR